MEHEGFDLIPEAGHVSDAATALTGVGGSVGNGPERSIPLTNPYPPPANPCYARRTRRARGLSRRRKPQSTAEGHAMAKGQLRSNREAKKPKATKKTVVSPNSTFLHPPAENAPAKSKKK
jgi:hypothetical protein